MDPLREKSWPAVSARSFASNGGTEGQIVVAAEADLCDLHVGQVLILKSDTLTDGLQLQIKYIIPDDLTILVGPAAGRIREFTDISGFTTGDNATFEALAQPRVKIGDKEWERALYEEEPAMRRRVGLIDKLGRPYDSVLRGDGVRAMPVDAEFSGTLTDDSPTKQQVIIHTVVTANTEFSIVLPANVKSYQVQVRDCASKLNLAFESGKSATEYVTIYKGSVYESGKVNLASATLYMQSPVVGAVIEVEVRSKP